MGSRSQSLQRYWTLRHARWEVAPSEVRDAEKAGVISESLKRHAIEAQAETLALVNALGGLDTLSEQRLILIQDAGRLGLIVRALTTQFLQGVGDPDLGTRIATITTARRTLLQTLGLNRAEHEVPDLHAYMRDLDAKKDAGGTNADTADAEVVPAEITSESPTNSAHSRVVAPEAHGNSGGAESGSRATSTRTVAHEGGEPC